MYNTKGKPHGNHTQNLLRNNFVKMLLGISYVFEYFNGLTFHAQHI